MTAANPNPVMMSTSGSPPPPQQPPPRLTIRAIPASATYALRHTVLWPHQPASYVELPDDAAGLHFGAFVLPPESKDSSQDDHDNGAEQEGLVSVISLFFEGGKEGSNNYNNKTARFRKFATATSWQGRGVGSALLAHTIEAAREAGAARIWCDARQSALPFYARFGMRAEGEAFFKGDVPYLRMAKPLS